MSGKIKDQLVTQILNYKSKSQDEILDERRNKFKSIGENLPADLVSFDAISQVNLKSSLSKNKKTMLISLAIFSAVVIFLILN